MQDPQKQLASLITSRKIDAFLHLYPKLYPSKPPPFHLQVQYDKWKAIVARIESLLRQEVNTKKWITHSNQQIVTSINKTGSRLQIKSKATLHEGYESLHRLFGQPNHIKQLLPFCQQLTELKTYSEVQKDVLLHFKVPIINERLIAARLTFLDRLEEKGTVVIFGEEVAAQQMSKLQESKQNLIKMKAFVCEVSIGVKEYIVSTYASLDGTLSFIPDFVLRKILKLANNLLVSNLEQTIKKTLSTQSTPSVSQLEERLRLRYLGRL